MGRKPNPERKPELLELIADEMARSGLGDLTLRPLAAALGVSTFTLSYHFGSKEQLLAEVLEHIESEQVEAIRRWVDDEGLDTIGQVVKRYWSWVEQPEHLSRIRLIAEAASLPRGAELLPTELRTRLVDVWVDEISRELRRHGVSPRRATAEATVVSAALVGMVLDLLLTGDERRLRSAANVLAERLDELCGVPA